jgi:predicted DNA binding CopG/RHH family protein
LPGGGRYHGPNRIGRRRGNRGDGDTNAPADIAEELKNSVPIEDFLPSPAVIAKSLKKQETVPVTMNLKKHTVAQYKRFAAKKGIKYQTFVSTVLDTYAKHL